MRTFKKSSFLKEYKGTLCECSYLNPLAGEPIPKGQDMPLGEVLQSEPLDELVDSDGSTIDGSTPDGSEREISAGPVQQPKKEKGFSDYKKGTPTTTDDTRQATSQGPDWQAAYGGLGGTYYSHGRRINTASWEPWISENMEDSALEESMTGMVEDMLTKKEKSKLLKKNDGSELTDKTELSDLIDRIKELNPEDKEKLEKLLSDAKS
tara:strand:- start:278 stop:901 length:624 start_codon:yes stop_codon:yes gene_type:complete